VPIDGRRAWWVVHQPDRLSCHRPMPMGTA
jgi:hypothetical protein